MSKAKVLIPIAVAAVAGIATADDARDPEMQGPPTKDPVRSGFTMSLAVGPGEMHLIPDDCGSDSSSCEQRVEGAAFSLRAGGMVSQRAALEAMIDFVDGDSQRSTVFGGSVKLYQTDALYLRLGGGLGMYSRPGAGGGSALPMPSSGTDRHYGVAGVFALGYEWFQLQDLGLFGELIVAGTRLGGNPDPKTTVANASLVFGITWY